MANDLISRQAAIDAIQDEVEPFAIVEPGTTCIVGAGVKDDDVIRVLEQLPSAEPEIIKCKDCKHFEYDHPYLVQGVPVLGHLVCNKWGDGCRTSEDGFCFLAERRTDE